MWVVSQSVSQSVFIECGCEIEESPHRSRTREWFAIGVSSGRRAGAQLARDLARCYLDNPSATRRLPLMLVGQLLALSYLSRLYGPPPGSQPLGKVSAIYIGLFLCVSVISTLALALPAVALGISRALVLEELHLWRPITAVLCTEGLGLDFALQLWFFGSFSSVLERRHYHNTPFKYAAALLCGTLLIGLQALVLGGDTPLALSHSLTLFVVTLWWRTGLEPIPRLTGH